jgi:hypothetical protein
MPPKRGFRVALVGAARLPGPWVLAGDALLLPDGLMITKVRLPLSGRSPGCRIGWMRPSVRELRAMGLSAGLFPWRGKSVLVGEGDRLGAVACVNLGEQVVDVAFDGAFADDEVFGDLAVRHAGSDE